MESNIVKILFTITLMIIWGGCKQKSESLTEHQKMLIELQALNERALKIIELDNPKSIKHALLVFDSILTICPGYHNALEAKYKLYYELSDYESMMTTINSLIKLYGRLKVREYQIHQAKIFELMNMPDSANYYYKRVLKSYNDHFNLLASSGTKGIVDMRLHYAECLAFYGESVKANDYLNKVKTMYSNLQYLKEYKLRTFEQWMNHWQWLNHDGSDYTKDEFKEYSPCK